MWLLPIYVYTMCLHSEEFANLIVQCVFVHIQGVFIICTPTVRGLSGEAEVCIHTKKIFTSELKTCQKIGLHSNISPA